MRRGPAVTLFLLLISPYPLWAAGAGSGCLKQVFGDYCLGGSLQQLLQSRPGGMLAQRSGERRAAVFFQGRERIYVMAYQGRIYKILHTFEPAGQTRLKDLRKRLESKYGAYRDQSHYPVYARTLAGKIGAIRRGEGELKYSWLSADETLRIELQWTRKLGVSLAYLSNELDAKQRAALDERL